MILECENLSKNYGSVKALDNLTLKIESGKIVGLLGPNGHGKTTLIKTLSGLLSKDKGKVLIDGKRIGVGTKKIVSYLPERSYLSPEMKIKEVVSFFQEFYEDFDAKKADAMLGELSLDKESKLKSLSKGNREKVQLIMVMSRKAKLYLLDEPMGGVDPAARDYILKTIISNYSEDATVIISTHLIQDVEQILDEVVFLKEGKVMLHSDVDELMSMNLGADGFITKPYHTQILLARIAVLLKRSYQTDHESQLEHNGVMLSLSDSTITANGQTAELTKNELRIMYYLFEHDGVICTRADLIEYLWDNRLYSDTSYHNEELKSLTRYRFDKVKERAKLKSSVSRLVCILFPELEKLVPTLHMASVYALLSEFPGAKQVANAHLTRLTNPFRSF